MKALIIGRYNGPNKTEEYREVREILEKRGFEAVFPTIAIKAGESIARSLSQLIEPFDTADLVFLMAGWVQCPYARLINAMAAEAGKQVIYQEDNSDLLNSVVESVEAGTGYNLAEVLKPGKQRRYYFARLILVHYLVCRCRMGNTEVKGVIGRGTVAYCKKQFKYELKYNPEFRAIYEKTEKKFGKKCITVIHIPLIISNKDIK